MDKKDEKFKRNTIPADAFGLEVFHIDTKKKEAFIGFKTFINKDGSDSASFNFQYVQIPLTTK